ncbi:MAG: hypothetical protein Q7R92_04405 [bacterium]|nr:hypothetical protein [bacterium]
MPKPKKVAPGYENLATVEDVLVRVPRVLKEIQAHSFKDRMGKEIQVVAHWRDRCVLLGCKVFINRHFYNIGSKDLGRTMLAQVSVMKKITGTGPVREFLFLDITIKNGNYQDAKYILKIQNQTFPLKNKASELLAVQAHANGIPLPGTDFKVVFEPPL